MADQVQEFVAVTGATAAVAKDCLEAVGGDLQEAIELFYAEGPPSRPSGSAPAPAAAPSRPAARPAARRAAANVRGLGDIGGDEESEDDEHNDYYVGGEKSGQVVRGAPKAPKNDVEGLFESARRAGAEEVQGMPPGREPAARGGPRTFTGKARTLAGGVTEPEASAEEEESPDNQEPHITIAFYRQGIFTVDDGEPRDMNDPANIPFMQAITRGQLPTELDPGDPNIRVNVNLVRRDEDYTAPAKPKYKAFGGSGHKLGGTDDAAPAPAPPPSPAAAGGTSTTAWEGADAAKPKTSIQLRLADGSRMVAEFNLTHTVGDIRRFIRASRPEMTGGYRLMTAFPSAQLSDDAATIEGAGLVNSVVIQKM